MADILQAIAITLDVDHEGGFQDNPKDRANWTGGRVGLGQLVGTKFGITTLDMPGVNIAAITPEQATQFYLAHFSNPLYSQINSQDAANKIFDMGVLFGVGTAVITLQKSIGCPADGIFGPGTLSLLNYDCGKDPAGTLQRYKDALHAHAETVAENPNDAPDLPDWTRRIDSY